MPGCHYAMPARACVLGGTSHGVAWSRRRTGHTPGMAGSVWFGGIVVVIGLVLAVVITPILFIPVGLILLLALFTGPIALIGIA